MKTLKLALLLALVLPPSLRGEELLFFRVAGPVVSTITPAKPLGYATLSSTATNATFTVQGASSLLPTPINWVDYIQVTVTNPVTTLRLRDPNPPSGMAFIPAGSFTMGDPFSEGSFNESPSHTVYVSACYMDRYEVTKALWDEVYQWATNHGYSFDNPGSAKATNHPVHSINWYGMVKWCNARSEKEGRPPAYFTGAALTTVYRTGQTNVQNDWVNWNAGYRLPTEAEWEKAARGGATGHRFPWSDVDTITHSRANFFSDSNLAYDTSPTRGYHPAFANGGTPYTSSVGYFAPNVYGLYDMAGNVWEWCWDWHDSNWYSNAGATQSDTRGPTGPLSYRVLRGGSWNFKADMSRCAFRYSAHGPGNAYNYLGFRCVRAL